MADRRSAVHRQARESLAVAVTLVVSAGFCFVAPSYFDATSRQRTIWLFCGATLAFFGFLPCVVLIDRQRGRRVISDVGFATLIVIGAVATGVLAEVGTFGPWMKGELKAMAFAESVVAFWALTRALLLRSGHREAGTGWRYWEGISQTMPEAMATLALIAGILNIVGAVLTFRKI